MATHVEPAVSRWSSVPSAEQRLTQGISHSDARERMRMTSGWSWTGGVSMFTGEKFAGALNYAGLWSADYATLRRRSRIAYWESVHARALLGRLIDNTVGTGMQLEAAPVWSMVAPGWAEEKRTAWLRNAETRFHLWASSREADASGRMSLYELQRFVLLQILKEGELVGILRASPDRGRMSPTQVQCIDSDQVDNPSEAASIDAAKKRGNRIEYGVEIDPSSRAVAYYVHDATTGKSVRVPVVGDKSGRQFVVHPGIWEAIGQVRGVPILAPIIHELQKLADYEIAELEATIINALFAAYVKPSPQAPASNVLGGIVERGSGAVQAATGDERVEPPSTGFISKPGLFVQRLKAGEDLASFDVKRPNVHFADFVKAVKSSLSSSLGLPVEILDMSFNANYSASRASILLFWTVVERWGSLLGTGFNSPVYAAWFAAEVAAQRIEAPGFGADPALRAAWLNADWVGPNKPSIDPKSEADAADLRVAAGSSTHEREAKLYNRSEFAENVQRLKVEEKELAEAMKPKAPKPAPGFGAPKPAAAPEEDAKPAVPSADGKPAPEDQA